MWGGGCHEVTLSENAREPIGERGVRLRGGNWLIWEQMVFFRLAGEKHQKEKVILGYGDRPCMEVEHAQRGRKRGAMHASYCRYIGI